MRLNVNLFFRCKFVFFNDWGTINRRVSRPAIGCEFGEGARASGDFLSLTSDGTPIA